MGDVKAGVVLVTKFVRPHSEAYGGYIDYIDRDEAVRNEHSDRWNSYMDYMGNPEKTSELFSAGTDKLSAEEKQQLKEDFIEAQDNGNLMWQTVLSFDNRWLEKQGLYDAATNTLNSDKIKELTRNSMKKMLEKEGILESSVWSAAIHYNTDNVHVHIATVEPGKTQRPMREDGEPKGVWRQSTLQAGKSNVVNNIMQQQEENKLINDIIRKNIVATKREKTIAYDKDLREAFLRVYQNLPANKQYWNYNSTNLGNQNRKNLDDLSKLYIEKFHQEDYKQFQDAIKLQQEKYKEAYGDGAKVINRYGENKEKELYERLGNSILKEMKEYDRQLTEQEKIGRLSKRELVNYKMTQHLDSQDMADRNIQSGLHTIGKSMNKLSKAFRKDLQTMKNQIAYEKLQQEIEWKRQSQDMEWS